MDTQQSCLVIGGGVAGASAATWLHELGASVVWVEGGARLGGTLWRVHNPISNHVGGGAASGHAMAEALTRDVLSRGLTPRHGVHVVSVAAGGDRDLLEVTWRVDGRLEQVCFAGVIVATGSQRRRLNLPGEEAHRGRGVAVSGRKERERFRGRRVTIVGGGDAAFENALLLAEVDAQVTLVNRSAHFKARGEFVGPALSHESIEVVTGARLLEIEGEPGAPFLSAVVLGGGERRWRHQTEGLLIRIGEEARVPQITVHGEAPRTVGYGFLCVDAQGRVGRHARLFGVGDCVSPTFRAVSVAAGQGAMAAHALASHLGHVV